MVYASDCATNNPPTSLASHEVTTNRRGSAPGPAAPRPGQEPKGTGRTLQRRSALFLIGAIVLVAVAVAVAVQAPRPAYRQASAMRAEPAVPPLAEVDG